MKIILSQFFFRHLDRSHGYPPNHVVDKFQQRLKAIKALDRYSDFVRMIKLDEKIKTPEDMINFIQHSIQISDQQGYTKILSGGEREDRKYDDRPRYNRPQQQYYRRN